MNKIEDKKSPTRILGHDLARTLSDEELAMIAGGGPRDSQSTNTVTGCPESDCDA